MVSSFIGRGKSGVGMDSGALLSWGKSGSGCSSQGGGTVRGYCLVYITVIFTKIGKGGLGFK